MCITNDDKEIILRNFSCIRQLLLNIVEFASDTKLHVSNCIFMNCFFMSLNNEHYDMLRLYLDSLK